MRADEQEPNRLSSSRRKMAWSVWAVLVLCLCCLTACEAPSQPEKAQLPAGVTPTPTWSRLASDATIVAVFRALPTLSPNPHMQPTVYAHWQTIREWDVAARTAVAL